MVLGLVMLVDFYCVSQLVVNELRQVKHEYHDNINYRSFK